MNSIKTLQHLAIESKVKGYLCAIDPETAQQLLDTSQGNRHLKARAIDQMAEQIRKGEWMVTGEPIIISEAGHLIDGHHRLTAIIQANKIVVLMVVEGIPAHAFAYIDIGVARTPGDIFKLAGISDSNNSAAAVRASLEYKAAIGKLHIGQLLGAANPSKSELVQMWVNDEDRWSESLSLGQQIYRATLASRAMVTGMMYLFLTVDRRKAHDFAHDISTGANLEDGNPALTFRNMMARSNTLKHIESNRRSLMVKLCQCWNAYRKGQKLFVTRHNLSQPIPDFQ